MSLNTNTTAIGTMDVPGTVFEGFWGSCQWSPFWWVGGVRPDGSIAPTPPAQVKARLAL